MCQFSAFKNILSPNCLTFAFWATKIILPRFVTIFACWNPFNFLKAEHYSPIESLFCTLFHWLFCHISKSENFSAAYTFYTYIHWFYFKMSYSFGFSDYAPFFKVGSGLHFLFVNIIIYNLYTFFSLLKLAHNVFGLGEGGDFHHPPRRIDAENQNFDEPQMCLRSTEPPLLPIENQRS